MKRRSLLLLLAITALGALLRVTSAGRIALWRDEVQALNISDLPSLKEITRFLYLHESHPPLFYYLEHFVGYLTGDVAAVMGVVVLLASIALIPAAWWLASLSRVRGAPAVAAALVAVSMPLSFFSVQLRPYPVFSLMALVGTAAIVQSSLSPSRRWMTLWSGMALGLLYLHHAATFVILAQLITGFVVLRPDTSWIVHVRNWAPYLASVALGAVPDLFMLSHQGSVAAYAVRHPVKVLYPMRDLWGMVIGFPGETGLALVGALACVLLRPQSAQLAPAGRVSTAQTQFAAVQFLVVAGLLTLASYRSNLLTAHVIMSTIPLGLVACGIAITEPLARMHRWRGILFAECAAACVVLSTWAFIGTGKTDTDLMARYVGAEARSTDLILLAPGALGPSFNQVYDGTQSQIDFPIVGKVARYEFDHDFDRVASVSALRATLDSIGSACRAGRRLWLISPAKWMLPLEPPVTLTLERHGGLGQADIARTNLLERRARKAFGAPERIIRPSADGAGVEHLEARLWSKPPQATGHGSGAECDVS